MAAKRFPVRWWLTTGLASAFVVLFAVGLFQQWPGLVMPLFVVGFCIVLWVVERHNEREADVEQIWWVPSSVLWGKPLRVVLSIVLMLAVFIGAAFVVFGDAGLWLLGVVVAVTFVYRLTVGRMWLIHDRAALTAENAPEGSTADG